MDSVASEARFGGNSRWHAWRSRLATLNLLVGMLFTGIFAYYAFRARFTVPYIDDWSWLASLQQPHPLSRELWLPHNEHVIVIPRLLLWLDFWIWGWPGYATLLAALASYATVATVLVRSCQSRGRDEARLLTGSVLVLSFLTYSIQGAVFPGAVLFPLVAAFLTLAIACMAKCAGNTERTSVARWATLSALMCVLAMLCLTNGLILPFVLAALAALLRLPRRIKLAFVALGVAGIAARYALGTPATVLNATPTAIVRFALAILAGPIASLSPTLAVWIGGAFCVLSAWALWRFLRAPAYAPTPTLLAGLLVSIVLSLSMAAAGRAHFDLSVAAESRYVELATVGWASLLLLLVPPGALSKPLGIGVAVVLPLVGIAALPVQILVGRVWAAKADHLDTAALALSVGVDDADWIWRIHPIGASFIQPVVPLLRARGVPFLNVRELGAPAGDVSSIASCGGDLEAIVPSEPAAGLRIEGHIRERGAVLRTIDRDGRVRGLAKPAPIVRHGHATANEFVLSQLDVVTGRLSVRDEWQGFSTWGAGPPFRAELVDTAGRPVCQMPVTCCSAPRIEPTRQELITRGGLLEGWLEAVDCRSVAGWAWDDGRPSTPIDVRVSISDGRSIEVSASTFRQDLVGYGKGDGRHAFALRAPDFELGPGTWTVSASIADTGVALGGSPRTIVCE